MITLSATIDDRERLERLYQHLRMLLLCARLQQPAYERRDGQYRLRDVSYQGRGGRGRWLDRLVWIERRQGRPRTAVLTAADWQRLHKILAHARTLDAPHLRRALAALPRSRRAAVGRVLRRASVASPADFRRRGKGLTRQLAAAFYGCSVSALRRAPVARRGGPRRSRRRPKARLVLAGGPSGPWLYVDPVAMTIIRRKTTSQDLERARNPLRAIIEGTLGSDAWQAIERTHRAAQRLSTAATIPRQRGATNRRATNARGAPFGARHVANAPVGAAFSP
jgi:hypothetical protein